MVPAKPERCEQTEIVTAVAGSDGSRARLLWATVDEASAIALSPDGLMVAMGAADGTVQAWDIRAGAFRLLPVGAHTGEVLDLAFDDAGRRLASSGVDGTIRIWDLAYDDPLRLACRKAGRNLSRGEWRRHVGDEFEYEETCPGLPSPLRPDWSINEAVEAPYLRGRGGDTPKAFAW